MDDFTPTEPRHVPAFGGGTQAAWLGSFPELPEAQLRVEAAAHNGMAVYFEIIAPWT